MNHADGTWRDHRDELFDRVVQRGRARKRRRGVALSATALGLVLVLAAGLFLPGRDDDSVEVVNPIGGTTTVPTPTGVLLVGDQVMLGAKSALENAIAGADIDAAPGRTFDQAIAILDAAKKRGALPPTIIVHLGDNGPSGDAYDRIGSEFRTIMETIGSDPEVYFVSVTGPRAQESSVNPALYSPPYQYPNAHVLAWRDFSRPHDDWFLTDGIRLTPLGQTAYAVFLRDAIRPPVTIYSDPFAERPIPPSGFVLADDAKGGGERVAPTFTMKLLDDSGNELGALPRGAIGNDVQNAPQHVLVVTDDGIHLEPAPLDAAGDLPSGCIPTEKSRGFAVSMCGSGSGYNLLGDRILVNNGTGWSELIALPPAPSEPGGHWSWASPSPDGQWVAAQWSGECEVPTAFLVSVADGSVHTVTGEVGTAWWGGNSPNSGIIGWRADGRAMGVFGGEEAACGSSAPVQRGVYLVRPDDIGSRDLLLPLTPSQSLFRWTSVDDRRTPDRDPDAEREIAYTFGHFFDPALTADERAALIQGSAAMRGFIDRSFARHASEVAAGAIVVDDVTVYGATADVSFHAQLGGRESPANPGNLVGTAVREDNTWKISRATYCMLSANAGEPCPPA